MSVIHAVALLALLACSSPEPKSASVLEGGPPRLAYRVRFDTAARDPRWEVELTATGFDPSDRTLFLELEDWGEWTTVDSYHLRGLVAEPPLARDPERAHVFRPVYPERWNGALHVVYSIPPTELGSNARSEHGLLPYRAPTYSFGFAANTLMRVKGDGMPSEVVRTIAFEIPADWTVASGFGIGRGSREFEMPSTIDNTVISFGKPLAQAASKLDSRATEAHVEIVQWGGGTDVSAPLLAFARTYLGAVTLSLKTPPTGTIRLIVTEPGFGGTRVDGAIAIGCPRGLSIGSDGKPLGADPYALHFLAHETFHDWLGGRLRSSESGESMAWFWEGFTEYLSLLQLARTGLVARDWFATRLLDHESTMRGNEHWGEVALADPAVSWRDSSIEPIAYGGSALVAFATDLALRRRGREGLVEMLRDFLSLPGGLYDRGSIREWLASHGAGDLWETLYEAPASSDVAAALLEIGFVEEERPAPLTYLGIELDRPGPFGTVVAVDPEGPAANTVQVGDVVGGLTPTREDRPGIGASVTTRYRFALEYYEPDAEQVRVDVEREGERRELWVRPRRIEGGTRRGFRADGENADEFFR